MKRNQLLNLLKKYNPVDPAEIEYKKIIINFVSHNKDCFERSLLIGHVTASAWLLNNDESQALLMHHRKLDRWFQLGGHCDGDSDTCAVAIKEAQEESGIQAIEALSSEIFDIDVHLIPANSKEPEHYHYDIRFLLKISGQETVIKNNESKELRWIGKNFHELPTQEDSVTRMFYKWISRK